tara:strand:+ start:15932 stop:16432 length:501 start_codon:yes stop_codon:yes gene_type:complete
MKKGEFRMKKSYVVAIAVIFTVVNVMILQQARISKLEDYLKVYDLRANVNADFTNELVFMRVNDVHKATQDQLVAQGRIEGVMSYLQGDDEDKDIVNKVWHEGYVRGLKQVDYEHKMVSESGFLQGYKAAVYEVFPDGNYPQNVSFRPAENEFEGYRQIISTLRER